jgi:hypothetical protein
MLAFLVAGMAFSFSWESLVHHTGSWVIPGDIWSTWRAAHWVGWGDLGGVYSSDTQLVTFPGIAVILAPLAMLSGHLGLTESIDPIFLARPSSWILLGPAIMLLGSVCLLAFDALAELLGTSQGRRAALVWMEATLIFQAVVIWGHPEDLLALALALYAFIAVDRKRWTGVGWLLGVAVAVQPLVLLLFPLLIVQVPKGSRLKVCTLTSLPSVFLVGTPLLSQWAQTSKVLFHQANFPTVDHPTPWIALSPRLSAVSVGAGPGRLIALMIAVGLGVVAWRLRPSMVGLLWLGAVALCGRCFFEAVMDPFYLAPPLAFIVLVASIHCNWPRLLGAWAVALAATVNSFHHVSDWVYWLPMVVSLATGLVLAWPGKAEFVFAAAASDQRISRELSPSKSSSAERGSESLQRPDRVLTTG